MTVNIKGRINFEDGWLDRRVYIVNEQGEKLDLFSYWNLGVFDGKFVSCRYAISNRPFNSLEDEELLTFIHGMYETDDREFHISEWTSSSYNAGIIGGHDLFKELKSYDGLFIVLEIKEVEKPSWMR